MSSDGFDSLRRYTRAFWIGFSLILVGLFLPSGAQLGGRWLGSVFIGIGAALLLVRGIALLVSLAGDE
jgi:hypothetical protein